MSRVQVHLKVCSGREFGGDYELIEMSMKDEQLIVDLQYCGRKSSKRLSTDLITIDRAILEQMAQQAPDAGA